MILVSQVQIMADAVFHFKQITFENAYINVFLPLSPDIGKIAAQIGLSSFDRATGSVDVKLNIKNQEPKSLR